MGGFEPSLRSPRRSYQNNGCGCSTSAPQRGSAPMVPTGRLTISPPVANRVAAYLPAHQLAGARSLVALIRATTRCRDGDCSLLPRRRGGNLPPHPLSSRLDIGRPPETRTRHTRLKHIVSSAQSLLSIGVYTSPCRSDYPITQKLLGVPIIVVEPSPPK